MATEFKKAESDLDELDALVRANEACSRIKQSALDRLKVLKDNLRRSLDTFARRKLETVEAEDSTEPGKVKLVPKYYGPKMIEKLQRFEERAEAILQSAAALEEIEVDEDVVLQQPRKPAVIPNDFIKSISTQLRPSREEEEQAQKRKEEEQARRALEALKHVNEAMVDDPLTKEREIFNNLTFAKGLSGFQYACDRVDSSRRKNLAAILEVITKHPEDASFRTLSILNPSVSDLISGNGVKESLAALGFRPQLVKSGKQGDVEAVAYMLVEPSVEKDFDAWSTWFDLLKAAFEYAKGSIRS